jgi:hypothetical protein
LKNKTSIFFLGISLPVIFFIIIISNMIEYSYAEFWSNALNLVITSILLVACVVNNFKMGLHGKHGRAWIFFTLAIGTWYVAERMWTLNELADIDVWPSYADLFWLVGYVFYFVFGVIYLRPFASQISRKNILVSSLVSLSVLIIVLYTTKLQVHTFESVLYAGYPIADSVMLIPTILGIMLFFKGRIKFSLVLLFFGMLLFVIADYGFLYFDFIGEYYTGHLVDIPYLWAYAILISGVISNLNLWNRIDKNKPFNDQDTMR